MESGSRLRQKRRLVTHMSSDYYAGDLTQARAASKRRARRHGAPAFDRRGARKALAIAPASPALATGRASDGALSRERVARRLLVATDAVMALLAVFAVTMVGADGLAWTALALAPVVIGINKLAGLYDRDHLVLKRSTLDEVPQIAQLSGLGAFVVSLLSPLLVEGSFSSTQALVLWVLSFALIVAGRLAARRMARELAAPERCLLVGDDQDLERLREKLRASGAHAEVVGTLPWPATDRPPSAGLVAQRIRQQCAHRVIIAPGAANAAAVVDLIRTAKASGARVSIRPRMLEAIGSSMEFETLDGMTILGVRSFGLPRSSRLVKRALDLAGALVLLLAMAPVVAAIALAIRLDSRGPVFFRQTRVGREGRTFEIVKFRTMREDAEALKASLASLNDAGGGFFKADRDPRITRVGGLLRKTSIDELPQLWNVVRGEMSLVGPRPLILDEDALVTGLDRARLHLDPGMTGPWQILGSSRIPMREMVSIDYLYVANWSLWADLKILLRTVEHVVARRNR